MAEKKVAESKTAETKYGKYIKREPIKMATPQQRKSAPLVKVDEEMWSEMSPSNCNFAFVCIQEPYLMPDPPHKHPHDEFLFFIGGNPLNVKDFGAEIEIALGEEWEKHTIDTTSIVYIPKGLQHCPINVKKVTKPIFFGHIMLSSKYEKE
jgi:mannose-6-phosphate isomerase-like protein (cupin superfamily)